MENEKNLLVESLKFDERANEDGYFAIKEHELIEEMKLEFHKAEAARRAAQMATCPKCSGTFEKYEFMGFILERCVNCEGMWLKKGELAEILKRQARGPLGLFLDRCFSNGETGKKS
jgi:Zn-finger nucleic acid-binding protein